MDWLSECRHRVAISLLVITRIIYKWLAGEAADVRIVGCCVRQAYQRRLSDKRKTRIAIVCNRIFATEGCKQATQLLLHSSTWTFSYRDMRLLEKELLTNDTKDRQKLSDLSTPLTGTAWLNRVLAKKDGGYAPRLRALEKAVEDFAVAGLWTKSDVHFEDIATIALTMPLLGKTLSVNFARALSHARESLGLPPLIMTERGWDLIVGMHDNVEAAVDLLRVRSFDDAQHSCDAISILMRRCTSGGAQYQVTRADEMDLALISCEYTCCLKQLRKKIVGLDDDESACEWLIGHLPHTQLGCSTLRRSIVAVVARNPNLRNGFDGARARNNLDWWLNTEPSRQQGQVFLMAMGLPMHCLNCHDIIPFERSKDARAKYCCAECKSESWADARNSKGPTAKKARI